MKSRSPVSISRSSSIQFTNRAVYNLSRVTVAVVSISQNTDIHLPSPLLRPARATCIHLAWLTLPPWSNIIAMELVSNVQTSIKSLCHKGLSRGARARSNAAPLSTPLARGKRIHGLERQQFRNDLPEFSFRSVSRDLYFSPREQFQLIL